MKRNGAPKKHAQRGRPSRNTTQNSPTKQQPTTSGSLRARRPDTSTSANSKQSFGSLHLDSSFASPDSQFHSHTSPKMHGDADHVDSDDSRSCSPIRKKPKKETEIGERFGDEKYLPGYPLPSIEELKYVQTTYLELLPKYEAHIEKDVMPLWHKSRERCEQFSLLRRAQRIRLAREFNLPKGSSMPKNDVLDHPAFSTMTFENDTDVVDIVACTQLPANNTENVPHFAMAYTNVLKNVHGAEPSVTSFIPYVACASNELDIVDFPRIFPQGIHGVREGWGKMLPDWILGRLEKQLRLKFKSESKAHQAINYVFPNKRSVSQLPTRLAQINFKERKNVDVLSEEYLAEARKRINNSTCLRCFKTACAEHQHDERRMDFRPSFTVQSAKSLAAKNDKNSAAAAAASAKKPQKQPCGPNCYLSVETPIPLDIKIGKEQESYIRRSAVHAKDNDTCRLTKMVSVLKFDPLLTCSQINALLRQKPNISPPMPHKSVPELSFDDIVAAQTRFQQSNHKTHMKGIFGPCFCKGGCEKNCRCRKATGICTRFCHCTNCDHRFMGCNCVGFCEPSVCECNVAGFECDPELCFNCKLEPGNYESLNCKNMMLQMNVQRKFEIKKSSVPDSGYGCFTTTDLKAGDFVGEYTGEIITQDEAERRGCFYDRLCSSYIFSINDKFCVDASRLGNLLRYVNHLATPNCQARIVVSLGEQRIAFTAIEDIPADSELFFDYSYKGFRHKEFHKTFDFAGDNDKQSTSQDSEQGSAAQAPTTSTTGFSREKSQSVDAEGNKENEGAAAQTEEFGQIAGGGIVEEMDTAPPSTGEVQNLADPPNELDMEASIINDIYQQVFGSN